MTTPRSVSLMRRRSRFHVDDGFIRANQMQTVVNLRDGPLGVGKPAQVVLLLTLMFPQSGYVLLNGRERAGHRNVLVHDARELDGNKGEDDDGDGSEDEAAEETDNSGCSSAPLFHFCPSVPMRRYFR